VLIEKEEERNTCIFKAEVTNQNGVVVADGKTYLKVL
jgi:3-hydroxybutyryl-CoA dehydratase